MSIVEVSSKYLAELERNNRKLKALEQGGVDDWEWYDESLKTFFKEERQQEILEDAVNNILEFLCGEASIYEPAGRGAGYTIELGEKLNRDFKELLCNIISQAAATWKAISSPSNTNTTSLILYSLKHLHTLQHHRYKALRQQILGS